MSGSSASKDSAQLSHPAALGPANQDRTLGPLSELNGPAVARGDLLSRAIGWVEGLGVATVVGAKRIEPLCGAHRHGAVDGQFATSHSAELEMQVTGDSARSGVMSVLRGFISKTNGTEVPPRVTLGIDDVLQGVRVKTLIDSGKDRNVAATERNLMGFFYELSAGTPLDSSANQRAESYAFGAFLGLAVGSIRERVNLIETAHLSGVRRKALEPTPVTKEVSELVDYALKTGMVNFREIYPRLAPTFPSEIAAVGASSFRIEIGRPGNDRAVMTLDLERSSVVLESFDRKGKLVCTVSRAFSGTVEALSAAMGARHALELSLSMSPR